MGYDLVNFDPVRCAGRGFSGWFSPSRRRAVFVGQMYQATSVKADGDTYDAKDTDVGRLYGIPRGRVRPLMPSETYALMFAEGWVRFFTEESGALLVMEGLDERLGSRGARLSGGPEVRRQTPQGSQDP